MDESRNEIDPLGTAVDRVLSTLGYHITASCAREALFETPSESGEPVTLPQAIQLREEAFETARKAGVSDYVTHVLGNTGLHDWLANRGKRLVFEGGAREIKSLVELLRLWDLVELRDRAEIQQRRKA